MNKGIESFHGEPWQKATLIADVLKFDIGEMPADIDKIISTYEGTYKKLTDRDAKAWDLYIIYESETAVADILDESPTWVDKSIEETSARFRADMKKAYYESFQNDIKEVRCPVCERLDIQPGTLIDGIYYELCYTCSQSIKMGVAR